jgi:hypothetical protein
VEKRATVNAKNRDNNTASVGNYGSLTAQESYDHLLNEITPTREALGGHWVYQLILDRNSLRKFMETHIFAVWDFMSLLKSLQNQLTCVTTPWFVPESTENARLINDIVLGEESDEVRPGIYMSHVELYLCAMEEIGADRGPFDRFIGSLQSGTPLTEALSASDIPPGVAPFVSNTIDMSSMKPHEVSSAFLFGREAIIPDMFRGILGQAEIRGTSKTVSKRSRLLNRATSALNRAIKSDVNNESRELGTELFKLYLERHIELDEGSHGPMSERLLISLCGDSEANWLEATESANRALLSRHKLWETLACEMVEMGNS